MKKIVKYEIGEGEKTLEMPVGAKVLSAYFQQGRVCVSALVDIDATVDFRYFVGFTDGAFVDYNSLIYIGTASIGNGIKLIHIFESLKPFGGAIEVLNKCEVEELALPVKEVVSTPETTVGISKGFTFKGKSK
jgi:predicted transcriptional regulator